MCACVNVRLRLCVNMLLIAVKAPKLSALHWPNTHTHTNTRATFYRSHKDAFDGCALIQSFIHSFIDVCA